MLTSANETVPKGGGISCSVRGTHITDHANTLSAIAMMPDFVGRTTFGNRPTRIVIPRFCNLDQQDGEGFSRGYLFQGGAVQSIWPEGKRMPGIGADLEDNLTNLESWRMIWVAFAESMPCVSNHLALGRRATDR